MSGTMSDKRSSARAREWADPIVRQRRIEALRLAALKRYRDPTERTLASERGKRQFADPERRAKHAESMVRMGERTRGRAGAANGLSRSDEYRIWQAMCARCFNPSQKGYADYGGRGIRVCDEWRGRGGFLRFIEHAGSRPSSKHSIGRIDNNGHYEPGNVKWETWTEQMSNTRRSRMVTINGETLCVAEWARRLGLTAPAFAYRIATWPEHRWTEPSERSK